MQEPTPTVVAGDSQPERVHHRQRGEAGHLPLNTEMTVLQLIAQAGGLLEYADEKHIVIIRTENSKQRHLKFNYKDVIRQKHPEQNIILKPGDTVVVP